MKLGILLLLGAGGLLFANSSQAKAGPGGSMPARGPNDPPESLVKDIDAARQSGDPLQLRAVAAKLQAAGYTQAAKDVLTLAAEIERALASGVKVDPVKVQEKIPALAVPSIVPNFTSKSPGQPIRREVAPVVVETTARIPEVRIVAPSVNIPSSAGADPGQDMAARLALHLSATRAGRENKVQIAEYQRSNALKPDGLYGPKTALTLADYGIVPPKPFYWPSATAPAAKRDYRAALLRLANADQARFDEWSAAGKV